MQDTIIIGLSGLACLIALIALRVPIAYAMILVGGIGASILNGPWIVLAQLKSLPYSQFSIYDLAVVPMFICMGYLAAHSGLSRDLFRAANAWLGRMRGGVAIAAIVACAGFGSVCGSSLATASAMGQVALPELRRYKYAPSLATGTLAAGGVLGILIPPSVVLIIYAIIVEANIITMFAAAVIPGLIAVAFFIVTIMVVTAIWPETAPASERVSRQELIAATLGVLPVLGVFGLVIGGIYGGFFNPTPAAAVGTFLVGLFGMMRGSVRWTQLRQSLLSTAQTSGMIYLILLGAELLKIFMSRGGVPQATAELAVTSGLGPYTLLFILLAALIILGCLMDSLSMILLVIPFFWPVISGLDFGMPQEDLKIWFGILTLIVVELGLITPPVGMNVFVINSLATDVPMRKTFEGVAPFIVAEVVRVGVLIAFPAITLALPHLMAK